MGSGGGGALLTGHIGVSTFISGPHSQNKSGDRVVQGLRETVSMRTGVRGSFLCFFCVFFKIPLKNTVSPNTGRMIRLDAEGKMKEEFLVLRARLLCVMALLAPGHTSG